MLANTPEPLPGPRVVEVEDTCGRKRARESPPRDARGIPYEVAPGSSASGEDIVVGLTTAAREAGLDLGSAAQFADRFELGAAIGRGAFSVVRACVERATGVCFAAKTIDARPLRLRPNFSPRRLLREAVILAELAHPNIVAFDGAFACGTALRLVTARAAGRELFEIILERTGLPEAAARPVLRQLAAALAYLHANRVAHRDVKPENVLVDESETPHVTLIDFGLSKRMEADGALRGGGATAASGPPATPALPAGASLGRTFVGTPCYIAPEIEALSGGRGRARPYGVAVDAWSLGAVLTVVLVARFPEFDGGAADVSTRAFEDRRVSADARDLVRKLMVRDPTRRLTTAAAGAHPWLAARAGDAPPAAVSRRGGGGGGSRELATVDVHRPHRLGDLCALEMDSLLDLSRTIGCCLSGAFASFHDCPEASPKIRRCAVLLRTQLLENTTLLKKIEHTATSVLAVHEDLELGVDVGDAALGRDLLATVASWVGALRASVADGVGNDREAGPETRPGIPSDSSVSLKSNSFSMILVKC